jgi:hypothetical protein
MCWSSLDPLFPLQVVAESRRSSVFDSSMAVAVPCVAVARFRLVQTLLTSSGPEYWTFPLPRARVTVLRCGLKRRVVASDRSRRWLVGRQKVRAARSGVCEALMWVRSGREMGPTQRGGGIGRRDHCGRAADGPAPETVLKTTWKTYGAGVPTYMPEPSPALGLT